MGTNVGTWRALCSCMATNEITVQGIKMTVAAAENVDECSVDVQADVAALRSGRTTREALLEHCLDGAGDDRVDGWNDYVDAVVFASERAR